MSDFENYTKMLSEAQVETNYFVVNDGEYLYEDEKIPADLVCVETRLPWLLYVSFFRKTGEFITSDMVNMKQQESNNGRRIIPRYAVRS